MIVFVPIPLVPIPASPILNIPSTKTSSPFLNGSWTKPPNGVSRYAVTTPDTLVSTEFIPTPFELLMATILWVSESSPFTGAITCTSEIVWLGLIACNDESSTTSLDIGL